MISLPVKAGVIERILNEGLVVLTPEETRPLGEANYEGVSIQLVETEAETPTGRKFFARGTHDLGRGYVQITLSPFMEAKDEEGNVERIPMAGDYANEKYVTPDGEWQDWQCAVKGEKPIWIYRGMKWVQELSLAKLFFGGGTAKLFFGGSTAMDFAMNRMGPPHTLHVKIQAQGGERVYKYTVAGEVE